MFVLGSTWQMIQYKGKSLAFADMNNFVTVAESSSAPSFRFTYKLQTVKNEWVNQLPSAWTSSHQWSSIEVLYSCASWNFNTRTSPARKTASRELNKVLKWLAGSLSFIHTWKTMTYMTGHTLLRDSLHQCCNVTTGVAWSTDLRNSSLETDKQRYPR